MRATSPSRRLTNARRVWGRVGGAWVGRERSPPRGRPPTNAAAAAVAQSRRARQRVAAQEVPERATAAARERHDQPVPVPGPRAAPVELRRIHLDVRREPRPRLVVREEVAPFPQEQVVEQGLYLRHADLLAAQQLLELPARARVWHDGAALRVDERRADVAEVERVV